MKQWNGMVRKEWVTMKWPLIVSALVAITVMAVFPFLITGFLAMEVHVFEVRTCYLFSVGRGKCVCTRHCFVYDVGE